MAIKENPHPSAVLELQSTDRGLLMPRLTQLQMLAIKEPANALIVYNTDAKGIFIYNSEQQQWLPLMQQTARMGSDSCEWAFDTTTLKVFLVKVIHLAIRFTIIRPVKIRFCRQTDLW